MGKAPLPDEKPQDATAPDVRRRQTAASYLRAARLSDDPAERESLKQKAAELLAPRRDVRGSRPTLDKDETR